MQKKSLLVMLFCGALCLTGCLKNEESASVAQVRIAKANELNSIADLNKAKAQAEVIYANAEATIANAEAKLREANAALVLAQAETEKVRAELLKVQVQLAEVTVEEEKVKLQLLEADLEKHLAEVEAAKAKAEAEKQGWINVLNHAIADAERQAIADAEEILKAEDALEEYLLKQEGKKAAAAKKVSKQYFDALEQIQALQFQQIKTKAQKALVEAGALEIRDAIHFAIDQIDEEIAKKEALVEYLKEYQTMTPEEAEEALKAARTELSEAYTAYKAAVEVESALETTQTELNNKTVEFRNINKSWFNDFKEDVQDALAGVPEDVAEYFSKVPVEVEVEGKTINAEVSGIKVPSKEKEGEFDFIPLWQNEAYDYDYVRYPELYVYDGTPATTKDFVTLTTTYVSPAAIHYDNVKVALDTVVAVEERATKKSIEVSEKIYAWAVETTNDQITEYKRKIDLHKKYIAAYKDTVDKYENAFKDSLAKKATYETNEKEAWRAFQEYMLLNYPVGVSRNLLIAAHEADSLYQIAKKDSLDKGKAWKDAQIPMAGLKEAVKPAFEAMAKAEGNYTKALAKQGTSGSAHDEYVDLEDAIKAWDPKFAALNTEPTKVIEGGDTTWYKGTVKAGTSQSETLTATWLLAKADSALYVAQIDFWRGTLSEAGYNEVLAKRNQADHRLNGEGGVTSAVKGAIQKESEAQDAYLAAKTAYEGAMGADLIAALDSWNPSFNWKEVVSFPTEARPEQTWAYEPARFYDGKYHDASGDIAASAQEKLIVAVKAVLEQNAKIIAAEEAFTPKKTAAEEALSTLNGKVTELLNAIKNNAGDPEKLAKAEELYEKYVEAHMKKAGVDAAWEKLQAVYTGFDPDEIGMPGSKNNEYNGNPKEDIVGRTSSMTSEFSWYLSNYHVNYLATVLDEEGEDVLIASIFDENGTKAYPGKFIPEGVEVKNGRIPDIDDSYQYKVEDAQNDIDVVFPAYLAKDKQDAQDALNTFKANIATILNNVNAYKAKEPGYLAWLEDKATVEAAINEAKKNVFDAEQEVNLAQAIYDALDAVANGGIWVYDPKAEIFYDIYHREPNDADKAEGEGQIRSGDFTWITVNDEIERLEGNIELISAFVGSQFIPIMIDAIADLNPAPANVIVGNNNNNNNNNNNSGNFVPAVGPSFEMFDSIAGLTFAKTLLQEALSKGKVALQVVIDAFDAELAVLDEKIDLYTKLAATYKGIMNALLGIVDEADVEGETGPLDGEGEGDDEE